MCGIAFLLQDGQYTVEETERNELLWNSIRQSIARRGPDGSSHVGLGIITNDESGFETKVDLKSRPTFATRVDGEMNLFFAASVLHVQGEVMTGQPYLDRDGNILMWNGEVFDWATGYEGESKVTEATICETIKPSDTLLVAERLRDTLDKIDKASFHLLADKFTQCLSSIQGPWAIIYWSKKHRTLFYGRDPFGRRSLLSLHSPDGRLKALSSVIPEYFCGDLSSWREVPVRGIFSVRFPEIVPEDVSKAANEGDFMPRVVESGCTTWPDERVKLCRKTLSPPTSPFSVSQGPVGFSSSSKMFLNALIDAMKKRLKVLGGYSPKSSSREVDQLEQGRVAILFSGGIDSVLLAAVLHICLESSEEPIDLLNVSFDEDEGGGDKKNNMEVHNLNDGSEQQVKWTREKDGKSCKPSPDRAAAIVALGELEAIYPTRRWRLVHIDVPASERNMYEARIKQLIKPRDTQMDLNIGSAFWFAARGCGYLKSYNKIERDSVSKTSLKGRPLLRIGAAGAAAGVGKEVWTQSTSNPEETQVHTNNPVVSSRAQRCLRDGCRRIVKRNCVYDLCRQCCLKFQSGQSGQSDRPHCPAHKSKYSSNKIEKEDGVEGEGETSAAIESATDERDYANNDGDNDIETETRLPFCSLSKILLVGLGADEQMAGYGRHRTTYLRAGVSGLEEELNLDLTRLWERNLGRDDRCISDSGKEAWFPFLDEGVVTFLQNLAIEDIADLNEAPGVGDKRILRDAARLLGLSTCSEFVKRAIQFGSRIAKLTSQDIHGSRRKGKGTNKISTD